MAEDTAVQPPVEEVQEPEVFVPQRVEVQAAESLKKTLEAEVEQTRPSEVVEYEGIFGPHTTLRYTPTFGGFKEDIILSRNIGVNEFSFIIETNGLSLIREEDSYFFADPLNGERVGMLDNILVFDSRVPEVPENVSQEKPELTDDETEELPGYPVYSHHYRVETVRQDEEYLVTLVVDEAYLNASDTVYPVTIDPTISFSIGNTGIEDATIYSGYKVNEGSSGAIYVGNYTARNGGTRGTARTLVKFPGLLSNAVFKSLQESQIQSVQYYARDVMCESDQVWVDCYRMTSSWSESGVKCNTSIWNAYQDFLDDALVYYGNGEDGIGGPQGGHWYGFDITQAAKNWKNGTWDHYGVMLKAFNESNRSRTFASADRASYPPAVVVSFSNSLSTISTLISNNGVYYLKNKFSGYYLNVENNGTANGTRLVQQIITGKNAQKFKLVMDNSTGYFRIVPQNAPSKNLFLNTSNQIVLSDDCTSARSKWRIKSQSNGTVTFINRYDEEKYAYSMGPSGGGCTTCDTMTGQSYNSTTRFQWEVEIPLFTELDAQITDITYKNRILFSQSNYTKYEQAYQNGTITLQQKNSFQKQVVNYADVARADYIITAPQSDYAYNLLGGSRSSGSPMNRTLRVNGGVTLMSGIDVIIVQRLLEVLDYYTLPVGELYGTYDQYLADMVSAWHNPDWTPTTQTLSPPTPETTHPEIFPNRNAVGGNTALFSNEAEGSPDFTKQDYNSIVNETTGKRSTYILDMLQEYSRQHFQVQTVMKELLQATGIEVRLPFTGPNKGVGRADILKKENYQSFLWEVKHKSANSMGVNGTGNAQIKRYLNVNNVKTSEDELVNSGSISNDERIFRLFGQSGFDAQKYSYEVKRGGTFTPKQFYIPYDSASVLLIECHDDVQGLITYDRKGINEKKPNIPTLSQGDIVQTLSNNLSSTSILCIAAGITVVAVGAAVLVLCPPAGVAATGQIIGTTVGQEIIKGVIVPFAQQAAEKVLEEIVKKAA